MRLFYVALVAAAALYTSTDGLPVVTSSALRGTAADKELSIEGKTERSLNAKPATALTSKTGQDVVPQRGGVEEETYNYLMSLGRKTRKKKKKKKKKLFDRASRFIRHRFD
ncbi:hypothetical protein DD237_000835 [Peronospora effusa]|uniref:RxLR effector protein n=1 Tax=Peronospora effusa TaxID=542832 RepID=A0A425C2L6_9STRA|nr:hypothetical protein DD237_000835 [Peronospora effusa]